MIRHSLPETSGKIIQEQRSGISPYVADPNGSTAWQLISKVATITRFGHHVIESAVVMKED